MNRVIFIVSALLSWGYCHAKSNIDTSQYAIIKYGSYRIYDGAKPSTLIQDEINEIEFLLIEAIQKYNSDSKHSSKIMPLNKYKLQFVPRINNKGEKEVWVNSFCETGGHDWKKELIIVEDGGNCYFELDINLTTKQYYGLGIGAYANCIYLFENTQIAYLTIQQPYVPINI
jgi:hypothetical protein